MSRRGPDLRSPETSAGERTVRMARDYCSDRQGAIKMPTAESKIDQGRCSPQAGRHRRRYFAAWPKRTSLTYWPTDRFASAAVLAGLPFSRRLSIVTP